MEEVGRSITYREAVLLVAALHRDPSSWLHAAMAGWNRPASYEWQILADLFDLTYRANSKSRPKPYPRPWTNKVTRVGGNTDIPQQDIRAALDAMRLKETDG